MSHSDRLSLEDRKKIQKMIGEGKKRAEIALALNRSLSCVMTEIRRNGQPSNYDAEKSQELADSRRCNSGKTSKLNQFQIAFIKDCLAQGKPRDFIAHRVGCANGTLSVLLKRLNLKGNEPKDELVHTRIEALEMQVQILTEQIKEILCQK